ncbi:MAG: coproporphyrinogen III oxidase, partial [Tepidisphaerales bacterium]
LYWNGGDYIALGPSGASHVQGWRWTNQAHLGEWESAVDRDRVPATNVESLTPRQRAGELAMLQLRLARGIDFADFLARTGVDARRRFAAAIEQLARAGLIDRDERGIRMTERGLEVADGIAGEFITE